MRPFFLNSDSPFKLKLQFQADMSKPACLRKGHPKNAKMFAMVFFAPNQNHTGMTMAWKFFTVITLLNWGRRRALYCYIKRDKEGDHLVWLVVLQAPMERMSRRLAWRQQFWNFASFMHPQLSHEAVLPSYSAPFLDLLGHFFCILHFERKWQVKKSTQDADEVLLVGAPSFVSPKLNRHCNVLHGVFLLEVFCLHDFVVLARHGLRNCWCDRLHLDCCSPMMKGVLVLQPLQAKAIPASSRSLRKTIFDCAPIMASPLRRCCCSSQCCWPLWKMLQACEAHQKQNPCLKRSLCGAKIHVKNLELKAVWMKIGANAKASPQTHQGMPQRLPRPLLPLPGLRRLRCLSKVEHLELLSKMPVAASALRFCEALVVQGYGRGSRMIYFMEDTLKKTSPEICQHALVGTINETEAKEAPFAENASKLSQKGNDADQDGDRAYGRMRAVKENATDPAEKALWKDALARVCKDECTDLLDMMKKETSTLKRMWYAITFLLLRPVPSMSCSMWRLKSWAAVGALVATTAAGACFWPFFSAEEKVEWELECCAEISILKNSPESWCATLFSRTAWPRRHPTLTWRNKVGTDIAKFSLVRIPLFFGQRKEPRKQEVGSTFSFPRNLFLSKKKEPVQTQRSAWIFCSNIHMLAKNSSVVDMFERSHSTKFSTRHLQWCRWTPKIALVTLVSSRSNVPNTLWPITWKHAKIHGWWLRKKKKEKISRNTSKILT